MKENQGLTQREKEKLLHELGLAQNSISDRKMLLDFASRKSSKNGKQLRKRDFSKKRQSLNSVKSKNSQKSDKYDLLMKGEK
jgi:hypothetical protein